MLLLWVCIFVIDIDLESGNVWWLVLYLKIDVAIAKSGGSIKESFFNYMCF